MRKDFSGHSLWIFVLIGGMLLQSCNSVNKDKVKESVEKFFTAYQSQEMSGILEYYPMMYSLRGDFRKSSSIDLNTDDIRVINDSNIIVNFKHHWVNPFGVDNTANMTFYMTKNGEKYQIKDSKNFCMYSDMKLYDFAVKVGALKLGRDTTDIKISSQIGMAQPMYERTKQYIRNEINNGLKITSWSWHTGYYSDYASGNGIVVNNSAFPVKYPKYTVRYYTSSDKFITSDDGTVCYGTLKPGESRSFSWYTSYVGNASRANVSVTCDDDKWIEDIISYIPFDGTEFIADQNDIKWWPF